MLQKWLIQLVVNFILTQIAKATSGLDWPALLLEAEAYVDKFIPSFLISAINGVVAGAVGAIQAALSDEEALKTILNDLASANYQDALTTLEALLAKVIHPSQPAVLAAVQGLKAA